MDVLTSDSLPTLPVHKNSLQAGQRIWLQQRSGYGVEKAVRPHWSGYNARLLETKANFWAGAYQDDMRLKILIKPLTFPFKWSSLKPTRRVYKVHSGKERRGRPDPLTTPHACIISLYRVVRPA
ncbi:hypothetical protein J6590_066593 [Homalodisca vitripennis]|nr:hypothetical protein J6590_066593 [Homalodisca vitripennis]